MTLISRQTATSIFKQIRLLCGVGVLLLTISAAARAQSNDEVLTVSCAPSNSGSNYGSIGDSGASLTLSNGSGTTGGSAVTITGVGINSGGLIVSGGTFFNPGSSTGTLVLTGTSVSQSTFLTGTTTNSGTVSIGTTTVQGSTLVVNPNTTGTFSVSGTGSTSGLTLTAGTTTGTMVTLTGSLSVVSNGTGTVTLTGTTQTGTTETVDITGTLVTGTTGTTTSTGSTTDSTTGTDDAAPTPSLAHASVEAADLQPVLSSQTISAFTPVVPVKFGTAPFTMPKPKASTGLPVTITVVSGPATISGNAITLTGTGTVVLAADQAGDSANSPAPEVTTTIVVTTKTIQTIASFAPITDVNYNAAPFTIVPPVATSGLLVAVTVKSGPATISGNTVTVTGPGNVVLAADQPGDDTYAPALEVTTSFNINPPPPSDPFGGTSMGSNWSSSTWFGDYNNTYYPWLYRADLGFIYISTTDNTNIYLYVLGGAQAPMGWLYTSASVYPEVYSFTRNSWLYFNSGTNFYNYTTASWETF